MSGADHPWQPAGGTATTTNASDNRPVAPDGRSSTELATVRCLLCGSAADPDDPYWGCARCGVAAPLALDYPSPVRTGLGFAAAVREARRAYATVSPAAAHVPMQPPTPLHTATPLGPSIALKNEAYSLTGSHKDRFHLVTARVARQLDARGIVASSTGNHGVSAAAHAAAVGLTAVVFCHPHAPAGLLRAIAAFGGIAVQLDPGAQREALVSLVRDGWFPATAMDPVLSGAANPFGAEGYKAIAYEMVEQLGTMPGAVFIPTAGGDTLYGVMKGLAELTDLSGAPMPAVFAVQPEGANPLSRSLAAGGQVAVEHPASIALSLSDPQTGRHAMVAIARWGGQALDVAEREIRSAIADLAGSGIYSDPASAAALAGYRRAVASGRISSRATAVLLLTSSGFKWPDAMAEVFPAAAVQSVEDLVSRLSARSALAERENAPAP